MEEKITELKEPIESVLNELKTRTLAIEVSAVFRSGLPLIESPDKVNEFAGMVATAMGSVETAFDLKGQGVPEMNVTYGGHSFLVMLPAGPKALLTLLFNKGSCSVLPMAAMKLAANKIAEIIK